MTPGKVLFLSSRIDLLKPWIDQAEAAGYSTICLTEDELNNVSLKAFENVTVVIEWLNPAVKQQVLMNIEPLIAPDTLVFSAAHEVFITTIIADLKQPNRVFGISPLGLYHANQTMITIAQLPQNMPQQLEKAQQFWEDLTIQTQWIQDTPGLVLPRIYAMLVNEAAFALQEGVASAEDIDLAMKLGTNYPYGPLEWADRVGLHVVLGILDCLWQAYKEERYRPCLLLRKLVAAKHLGIYTGQGFHRYETSPPSSKTKPIPKEQVQSAR